MKISYKQLLIIFFSSGFLIELLLAAFPYLNDNGNIPLYMFIYFEFFLLFFLTLFFMKRYEKQERVEKELKENHNKILQIFRRLINSSESSDKIFITFIIVFFGILFRLTLFTAEPTTSYDVARYIWDGKVIYNGFNPYLIPPEDSTLNHLKEESDVYDKVTYKQMTTIYPPLAEISFFLNYAISGESFLSYKLTYFLAELITILFLLKLLSLKKIKSSRIILYAWLPLPTMEFFINIHIEPVGVMFMIIFLYLFEKEKYLLSSAAFAFSVLIKFFPLILIPLIIKKLWWKKFIYFFLIFISVVILFYIPFIQFNEKAFEHLFSYLSRWEFYGPVYKIIKSFTQNGETARLYSTILLFISVIIITIKYKDFLKSSFGVFFSLFIFSATLYPWYLGWLAVLNPFSGFLSPVTLFFTSNFTNFTPLGDTWKEYKIIYFITYFPVLIFLIADLILLKKQKKLN